MKRIILLSLATASLAVAKFESWTNQNGQTAELELLRVIDNNGEKAGEFVMRNGRKVTLKASDLSKDCAAKLDEWKPAGAAATPAKPSVFDSVIDGNLLRLSGRKLKKCSDATQPQKYYVFYYTASWCGPCQAFTPSLVDWYQKNKNENFELVLISSDRDEDAMEGYAADKKMPWPQLKLGKVQNFRSKFQHGVSGIPSLIACDLEGNNLGNFRSNLDGLADLVKD
ncbi:MAG: thioredoxin-like domain-containing protein [Luteolibacter sp.]